jgi:arabinofuranosyltransferase
VILNENGRLSRLELVSLFVALALAAALMWPVRGYLTDDTFIHLQYARHLAEGNGFVFNPGERVYGSTSPLWVALLADGLALGLDGLWTARALGAVATLGTVVLFMQLMRRTLRLVSLRCFATIVWAAHPWMIRWSLSGMETPLAVALVLAGFVAFTEGKQWGSRPVRTGALWALAALTRPEAVFLLLLWFVFLVIDTDSREGVRRLIAGLLPPAFIYGGWLLFARLYFGTFWPNTLSAKVAGGVGWEYVFDTLARQVKIVGASDAVLAGALLAALVFGGARLWPSRPQAQRLLPWVWVFAVPVLYVMRGVPVLSRYLLPLLPVLAWLSWRSVERWWAGEDPAPAQRRGAVVLGLALATLALVQGLWLYSNAVLPQVRSFSAGLRQSLVPWGEWFGAHTRPGDTIAAPDIGALGYYGRRRVLDLAGLVTPRIVPLLERETPEDLVANFSFAAIERPQYLVERAPHAYDLVTRSRFGEALVPLGSASVPNLGIARPDAVVYSFYRIDWAVYDSILARR